jgi:apolipoprotein N-acyltransferase
LRTATLLVNVTNDAWFGESTARYQHLQISRMRALEAGRPLVRAANTGVSAFIESDGRIASIAPEYAPSVLVADVQPRIGLTPYARTGNSLIVVLALVMAGAGAYFRRRNT